MPSRIKIIRGHGAGTVHEIHVNFLRIGSELSCDFCLPSPDVPAVAFLVEYSISTKSYRVHCRCKDSAYYQGKLLTLGDKRDWKSGQELAIGQSLVLVLESDSNPSPSPPISAREKQNQSLMMTETAPASDNRTEKEDDTTPPKSQVIPILVIVGCCIISALALMYRVNMLGFLKKPEIKPPSFEEVVSELNRFKKDNPQHGEIYMRLILEAHREEIRFPQNARENYLHLRKQILQDRELNKDIEMFDRVQKTVFPYISDRIAKVRVQE